MTKEIKTECKDEVTKVGDKKGKIILLDFLMWFPSFQRYPLDHVCSNDRCVCNIKRHYNITKTNAPFHIKQNITI